MSDTEPAYPAPDILILLSSLLIVSVFVIFYTFRPVTRLGNSPSSGQLTSVTPAPGVYKIDHPPIDAGNIILTENNQIFLLDTHTMTKTPLALDKLAAAETIQLALTPDRKSLIVSSGVYPDSFLVNVYSLPSLNLTASLPRTGPSTRVSAETISPNNKYMLIDESCCPGDYGRTIATLDGQILKQLVVGGVVWSPDSSVLAVSKGSYLLDLPTGPQPMNDSVLLETINGGVVTETQLLKANDQLSFSPLAWSDNQTLIYSQSTFSQPFPQKINPADYDKYMQVYESPVTSYFSININTGQKTNLPKYKHSQDRDFNVYSPDRKWKIFSDNNNNGSPWSTYISQIDGQDKFKISGYSTYVWLP